MKRKGPGIRIRLNLAETCGAQHEKSFLKVIYQDGRPEIAYLSLPRQPSDKIAASQRVEPDMVLDFNVVGNSLVSRSSTLAR